MRITIHSISTTWGGDRTPRRTRGRSGQAILLLVLVLVILVFIVLWNFDLHKILYVKSLTQNAGDAAALMAARWQGISLNLIGDLNVAQALSLAAGDSDASAAISEIQARLCYVGPMIGFIASQQAAKNNGLYRNPEFDRFTAQHADVVRYDYPAATDAEGNPLFPEPYPGCWREYADMLDLAAYEGIAAGPDNARFYTDIVDGHILLTIGFYEAVAGEIWCWFYHNAPTLLEDYRNFPPCWWPPLPQIPHREYMNSEIFGLALTKQVTSLSGLVPLATLEEVAADRGLGTGLVETNATWYCYAPDLWAEWTVLSAGGPDPFPLTGLVRPQYDYVGADAAVRIETLTSRVMPGSGETSEARNITWTAAAKPFGYLNEADRPNRYGLVLPAFHEVRLIPVDACSMPAGGGYNLAWREHVEQHLPKYMESGPRPSPCWYCRQLLTWEDVMFRRRGIEWLRVNSERCEATGSGPGGGGGGGGGGGTRRGH